MPDPGPHAPPSATPPACAPPVASPVASPVAPPAAPPAAPPDDELQTFIGHLRRSLADGSFVKLQLGRPQGGDATLDRLLARRLLLRGVDHLSLVWRHHSKDITKNLPIDDAVAAIGALIGQPFQHAHLLTHGHDIQLGRNRRQRWRLQLGRLKSAGDAAAPDPAPAAGHDRKKHHPLTLDTPFLAELGVTDEQARLVPAMARKWRQINRFVELLTTAFEQSVLAARDAAEPVRVLDFGAGKGYLTFAVHHQLLAIGRRPQVTGVELRDALTALGNDAARRLALDGLDFVAGDIRDFGAGAATGRDGSGAGPADSVDIMIALHACDTATDLAMHQGVRRGAAIILCSPCCHKELRPQMRAPSPLQPMLRHGIHMAEQAEMLTDSLRALLLQTAGYDSQVFEFISPEHTSKNRMVLAVRRRQPPDAVRSAALWAQVDELKAFYGVTRQTLEELLRGAPAGRQVGGAGQPRSA